MPAGLALYMAYLWWAFGDPLLFGSAQAYWGRELTLPTSAIWRGAVAAVDGVRWVAAHGVGPILGMRLQSGGLDSTVVANLLEFTELRRGRGDARRLLAQAAGGLHAVRSGRPAVPAALLDEARPLYTLPRFIIVIFPLFIGAAVVLAPHRVWRWVVVGFLGALLVVSTVLFASFT